MSAIDISSTAAPLNDGVLQLENGVVMSSTLTSVTDQNNTASTLKLSTTSAQFVSPLRITTDDPSDFYLDCEDGSTNNRFSITRNTSSQQVNLNFASNPAGSTTIVGAVRTYVDGTNLSEVMTFREDGYINAKGTLQVGTDGQNGSIVFPTTVSGFATSISTAYANNRLTIQCGGATNIQFNSWLDFISSGNTLRIDGGTHTTTLSTNNITRFVNTGFASTNTTYFSNTNVGVNETSPTAKLQIKGSGSTSATTSFLVQNSAGSTALQIQDDGNVNLGNATDFGVLSVPRSSTFGERVFMKMQSGVNIFATSSNDGLVVKTLGTNFNQTIYINDGIIHGKTGTFSTNTNAYTLPTQLNPASSANSCVINLNGGGRLQGSSDGQYIRIEGTMTLDSSLNELKGFFFNPTLIGAFSNQNVLAIHSTYGGAYLNTATPQASAILQADSTTQGFLPPRMTNAQRAAITTPAIGLMVYCTDVVEGLYVYKSTGWTFVI